MIHSYFKLNSKTLLFYPFFQVSVSQSEAVSLSSGPVRSTGPRPTVPPSINLSNRNRNQVRTRVRRPPPAQAVPEIIEESGPPSFALSSAEDIQKFRESNPFGPRTTQDEGRLTFLNSGQVRQDPSPVQSFAAVPAVPEPLEVEPATFGSRFQSRRPPSTERRPQVPRRQPQPVQEEPEEVQPFTRTRPTPPR